MASTASAIPQIVRRYPRSSGVLGLSSKDTEKSISSAGGEPFTVTNDSGTESSDLCIFSGGSVLSSSTIVNSQLIDSEARTHITLAPRGSLPGGFTAAESHVDRQVRYLLSGYGNQCSWTEADGDWDSMSGDLLFLPNSEWKTDQNGARFLTSEHAKNSIYMRPCYMDVYAIMDKRWRGDKNPFPLNPRRCALISGTPGIGKSTFGLVLVNLLMQREKPVLLFYKSDTSSCTQALWQGCSYDFEDQDARKILRAATSKLWALCSPFTHDQDIIEIWSIGDTALPLSHKSINQVCITSPGNAADHSTGIKSWAKNNKAITLTIPTCTWDEICHIRRASFGDLADERCDLQELRKRFDMWGGVPRTIIDNPELCVEHENEFRKLRIEDAIRYLGTSSLDHGKYPTGIFHLVPGLRVYKEDTSSDGGDSLYESIPSFWWASDLLHERAWKQFRQNQETDVINFIENLGNDPISRDKAWEVEVHHLIEIVGICGELRNLETGETTDTENPPSQISFFETFADINETSDYWRPVKRNHRTCQLYRPSHGVILQLTVGKTLEIDISGLEEAIKSDIFETWKAEHPNQKLWLIFVVYPSAFMEFDKQTFKYSEPSPSEGRSKKGSECKEKNIAETKDRIKSNVEKMITQYVLTVDLGDRLRDLRNGVGRKRGREEDDLQDLVKLARLF